MLFLASVYQPEANGGRFVIITAPADETVKPIHDRMPARIPVRISEPMIEKWLSGAGCEADILDNADVPVRREQDVEQLSLWD